MSNTKFVVCVDNSDYSASLEQLKIYQVVSDIQADTVDMLRIVDESGEDYLYPSTRFISIELNQEILNAIGKAA